MADPIARTTQPTAAPQSAAARDAALRKAAEELEAGFLAEMLKQSGLGKARESMGGGIGEEQFGSFLVQEQAKAMVQAGGIGLAEQLFNALKKGE